MKPRQLTFFDHFLSIDFVRVSLDDKLALP